MDPGRPGGGGGSAYQDLVLVWGVAVDQVHYHWREIRAVVFWETGEMIERKNISHGRVQGPSWQG